MPQLDQPWRSLAEVLINPLASILLIVLVAVVTIRAIEIVAHRLVESILLRQLAQAAAPAPGAMPGPPAGERDEELAMAEAQKRMGTLESLARQAVRVFVLLIAALMILGKLGLDIGPAIAGLGIVGIAIGFGAQSLVKDYFTGALIVAENQFAVGDVVTIAGVSGVVEDFSLRRTTLRDLSGLVHTVPNGEIAVATNRTRLWARINEDVSVAYGTDIDGAIAVVKRIGEEMARDPDWGPQILEPPQVLRVQLLGDSGVTLKVLGSVRASEQWAVAGELRKRLLSAFAREGIEIPYPHRVVIAQHGGAVPPPAGPPIEAAADARPTTDA